jgi:hypothetical protein
MAVTASTSEVTRVAAAAGRSYAVRGEFVVESMLADAPLAATYPDVPGSRSVVVPERRRCEIVLDDEAVVTDLIQVADALDADGWEVVVLLPSSRLGEAHAGLRGTPCTLQSWWWHGDRICFGGSEIP